jgi:hypothetical protein
MSADGNAQHPGNDPLQFDVAESSATETPQRGNTTCKACSRPIVSSYYQINGAIVCASCRGALENPPGTPMRRALRATAFGALAALGGSLLYFAVAAITGREFGLVAIVVGYMVGMAVRKGSRGRGGWPYQTLAIGLTYLAIVTSYIPLIAKEFQKTAVKRAAATHSATPMADTITISARGPDVGRTADSTAAANRASDSGFAVTQAGSPQASVSSTTRARPKHIGPGTFLLGVGALVLLAAMIPILAGFSNIIGFLIIGIAVFEAWKLNRRVTLNVTGPHRLGGAPGGVGAVG